MTYQYRQPPIRFCFACPCLVRDSSVVDCPGCGGPMKLMPEPQQRSRSEMQYNIHESSGPVWLKEDEQCR